MCGICQFVFCFWVGMTQTCQLKSNSPEADAGKLSLGGLFQASPSGRLQGQAQIFSLDQQSIWHGDQRDDRLKILGVVDAARSMCVCVWDLPICVLLLGGYDADMPA